MGLVLRREPIRLVPEVFYPGSEGPTVWGILIHSKQKAKVSGNGKAEKAADPYS